ncbi:PREDICTED: uncharacterized protein LOC109124984 [Camelina sativa]|uniref:Uncharacterized protein LOC109124984 n=1 Tax=Camelina sativa TaxID=90675 RepID=A0ABM1QHP0_CAMSA|nr:PREDICTED: uncharacterized protein LOC109124984 [Camelina sativa]
MQGVEEEEEEKTLVWWDISSCPIPTGYDPCLVGPRIVSAWRSYRMSGPITITAIGRLTHHPNAPDNDVLRKLSSSGISLIHANELQSDLFDWVELNPPPANILLISGPKELESLARTLYRLDSEGYTIFLAYPQREPAPAWLWKSFLSGVYKEWLWTSLLTDEMGSCSEDEDKCSQTGESPTWSCTLCAFSAQSFEDFTTHLKSKQHAHAVSIIYQYI